MPMKKEREFSPTWRKPAGVLLILALICLWSTIIVSQWDAIGRWPIWAQSIFYLVAGIIWLPPLKPLLIWMETGSFKAPRN
jgi:hypothetical protein